VRAGKVKSGRKRRSPVTVHLRPSSWRARADVFPGTKVDLFAHDAIAGADLYGGVIEIDPGTRAPLHFHRRGELQFVLSGRGFLLHPNGRETAVGPHSAVFSPAGRAGAHGFRAVGRKPLAVLFLYGSRGGKRPWIAVVKD
jgi:mannose-6-phosphate isomerase-like protein (cupin superfamily)